jgi:hypothetical protein
MQGTHAKMATQMIRPVQLAMGRRLLSTSAPTRKGQVVGCG